MRVFKAFDVSKILFETDISERIAAIEEPPRAEVGSKFAYLQDW